MRRTLRRGTAVMAAVLAVTTAAACSTAANGGSAPVDGAQAPGADALEGKGQVEITFWHAMTGANGEALQKITDQYNQQNQGKIKVNLAFKNDYDATLTAYKSAAGGGQLPDLVQIYDIGTRYMIDSQTVLPVQSFVDKDGYDVSDIQPNIAGYYTVEKKLYSMPFNTSMPVLYVNKNAFTAAGLDPANPPKTLDEIRAAAEKLTIKDASGNTTQYGFGASLYGWFFEQWVATSGKTLCDADNGRNGRPTKVTLATEENVKLVQWWQKMVADGLALPLDSDTKKGDNAFSSGTLAISLESTGSLSGFVKNATGKFEVGTGYYPKIQGGDTGGPIIGGASLWIVGKNKAPANQRASWEFVKFLADKQTQATWHTSTGYFPISKGALETDIDKQWVAQRPQFETAIKQLADTKLNTATQGCSVGVMPQIRKDVEDGLQAAVLQKGDAQKSLSDAEAKANKQIEEYNKSLGG